MTSEKISQQDVRQDIQQDIQQNNKQSLPIKYLGLIFSMIKMYIHIYMTRTINYVLRSLGYTRVYDLDSGEDLTIFYHVLKTLPILNLPITFDITYQRLGICTYIDKKYVRYVCYNTKLLSVIKTQNDLSSKHYHSIKKIELIPLSNYLKDNSSKDTISEDTVSEDNNSKRLSEIKQNRIDMTDAKNHLYDVGNFTRLNDVIRFYQIINNVFATYDAYDKYMKENIKSINIHREYFDDDLIEFIKSQEKVYIETN